MTVTIRRCMILRTAKITDALGRTFCDELSGFLKWYMKKGPALSPVPLHDSQHFVEGVSTIVLYRNGQFQVQMVVASPDTHIPAHKHPNVDSYEVFLRGMEFEHDGKIVLTKGRCERKNIITDMSRYHGTILRVLPMDSHGGISGATGGAFLSVQHWLNGIKPSSVGNDWEGQTMGPVHDSNKTLYV